MLADILVSPLQQIETVGGDVWHTMKQTDVGYAGFGEAYFSWVASGAIKAWKRHTQMTMNLVVPVGQVRFVFRVLLYPLGSGLVLRGYLVNKACC